MSNRDGNLPGCDDAYAQLIAEQRLQGIHLGRGDECRGLISKCWNIEDEVFGERKIWYFKCLRCGRSVDVSIGDVRDFEDKLLKFVEELDATIERGDGEDETWDE